MFPEIPFVITHVMFFNRAALMSDFSSQLTKIPQCRHTHTHAHMSRTAHTHPFLVLTRDVFYHFTRLPANDEIVTSCRTRNHRHCGDLIGDGAYTSDKCTMTNLLPRLFSTEAVISLTRAMLNRQIDLLTVNQPTVTIRRGNAAKYFSESRQVTF